MYRGLPLALVVLAACSSSPSPMGDGGSSTAADGSWSAGDGTTETSSSAGSTGEVDSSSSTNGSTGDTDGTEAWIWELPPGFPEPWVPDSNPMSAAKVELGRHLFFDARLSGNGTQSCGSCHDQSRAFSDGLTTPTGSTGMTLVRNSMSLVNTAYSYPTTWANPQLETLEQQILVPLFAEFPVELGVTGHEAEIVQRLRDEPIYSPLFADAFPDDADPYRIDRVRDALACFVRTMISGDSPFDRYSYGDGELSESALRGLELFYSEAVECHHCHGGFNFTLSVRHAATMSLPTAFHNTGLYNIGGVGDYPTGNQGLFEITFDPDDRGRFRAPSLRNVAVSAPYMHDGSVASLDDALDIYAAGGRVIEAGPFAGDGRVHPNKSGFVGGFEMSAQDRADLVAFLESLTDEAFLNDPRFANPWP